MSQLERRACRKRVICARAVVLKANWWGGAHGMGVAERPCLRPSIHTMSGRAAALAARRRSYAMMHSTFSTTAVDLRPQPSIVSRPSSAKRGSASRGSRAGSRRRSPLLRPSRPPGPLLCGCARRAAVRMPGEYAGWPARPASAVAGGVQRRGGGGEGLLDGRAGGAQGTRGGRAVLAGRPRRRDR